MPRRATTRWSVARSRRLSRLALSGVVGVVLVGVAVACMVRPFTSVPLRPEPLTSGAGAAGAPALADQVIAPQGDAANSAQTATTPSPQLKTQRAWDSSVPGITNDPVLASKLDQALVGLDGHVGVAVKDLGSGRGAVLDGDLELQSASLYKLPVLYTVFDEGLSMSEPLTITEDALSYDSGTMELGAGETITVAEALERMVTLSDNTSAILLGSRVGAGNINANLAALGMDTTHYSEERMTTSGLDMLHFLELVATGKAVSPGASADMLHLMLRQRVNDRLPRLLSDDVQIAHKTGNLPGVVNDVGILYGPTSTVAVAVLVSDTTDETAAATAIAQIGLDASSYFQNQPEVADRPLIPPAPSRPIPPVWREPNPPTATPVPLVVPVATRSTASAELSPTVAATSATARTTAASTPTVAATATAKPAATVAPTATAVPTQPPAPTATRVPPATATPIPTQVPTHAPTIASTSVRAVAPTATAPTRH